jgi:NAD(P)H-quinone oxidoreductase subunit 5
MNLESFNQHGSISLMLLIPLLYGLSARRMATRRNDADAWRFALGSGAAGLFLALSLLFVTPVDSSRIAGLPLIGSVLTFRLDLLSLSMLLLISLISLLILRFARTYLQGDPGQRHFLRWFFGTIASVTLLVASNHLLLMLAGLTAASLCLHQLLIFYPERPQAQLAAHKKFLLSRLADVCLLAGFLSLGLRYDSFHLHDIVASVEAAGTLRPGDHLSLVLLAFAMTLKCAQLPFHGWLIQVMEAPTPVSALLHAGVVNMGGFLMIRLASLVSLSAPAQWLLVLFGGLTAVVAGLVMMTRISVKVMLAWSTCAQMGFMLLECGLGAYPLALLHLLAHSLYKAHSFLRSGSAVNVCVQRQLLPMDERGTPLGWLAALGLGFVGVSAAAWITGVPPSEEPAIWAMALVVSVGIATLMAEGFSVPDRRVALRAVALAGGVSLLYFEWDKLFLDTFHLPGMHAAPFPGMIAFVILLFLAQYALMAAIRLRNDSPRLQHLQFLFYHGLYLDELFTRATFRIWPPSSSTSIKGS